MTLGQVEINLGSKAFRFLKLSEGSSGEGESLSRLSLRSNDGKIHHSDVIEFGELVRMFTLCAGSPGGAGWAAGVFDMCGSFTPNEVLGPATRPGWAHCH